VRLVIQRVSRAEVRVGGEVAGRIGPGLLLLVAVEKGDSGSVLDWCSDKVLNMRIFEDSAGKMNRSVLETRGEILVVSQFTLAADLTRGRRPGFEKAAPPSEAEPVYRSLIARLATSGLKIETGRFREFMDVELVNDGPVTFILDSGGR
jgi:D-tyrosyl-tRNA(Tyr) deacylase